MRMTGKKRKGKPKRKKNIEVAEALKKKTDLDSGQTSGDK